MSLDRAQVVYLVGTAVPLPWSKDVNCPRSSSFICNQTFLHLPQASFMCLWCLTMRNSKIIKIHWVSFEICLFTRCHCETMGVDVKQILPSSQVRNRWLPSAFHTFFQVGNQLSCVRLRTCWSTTRWLPQAWWRSSPSSAAASGSAPSTAPSTCLACSSAPTSLAG